MLDFYNCFEYNMNDMNSYKRTRILYLFLTIFLLSVGALIYILFRQGTYIHKWFEELIPGFINCFENTASDLKLIKFLKYYFVDFVWCLALNFSLLAVLDFKKTFYAVGFASAVFGFLFELAQLLDFVSGTFDFIDVVMYIIASLCAVMVNIKIIKRMD